MLCVCIMCNTLLAKSPILDNPLFCPKDSEDVHLEQKSVMIFQLDPRALTADNAYQKAMRVTYWA